MRRVRDEAEYGGEDNRRAGRQTRVISDPLRCDSTRCLLTNADNGRIMALVAKKLQIAYVRSQ